MTNEFLKLSAQTHRSSPSIVQPHLSVPYHQMHESKPCFSLGCCKLVFAEILNFASTFDMPGLVIRWLDLQGRCF